MTNPHHFSLKAGSVLAASLTILLAACGGGSGGSDAGVPAAGDEQVVDAWYRTVKPTSDWQTCASEGQTCRFSGTAQVRYGLKDKWAYKTASNSIACSNQVFGDPYVGADKICQVKTATSTTPAPAPAPTPTPTPTPTPAPTPTVSGPAGQDASMYTLAFNEDFNSFNTSVWNDRIWYQSSNATKNYTVENGVLKIWPQRDASGNFFDRTIDTDGKYYQTYGYFEMEAKLPVGKGVWPAFWLLNHDGSTRPEIDIMEAYPGGGPNSGWSDSSLHPTAYGATAWPVGPQTSGYAGFKMVQTPDLSAGFHKYGLKWEPNKLTYYFDGKEVYAINVSMPSRMYILLDLWYGSASGTPDNTTPTGKTNSFEVNYVRAWKFK